jgi:hypothetical protein
MGTSMNVRGLLGECKRRNDVGRYAELDDESARLGKIGLGHFFFPSVVWLLKYDLHRMGTLTVSS